MSLLQHLAWRNIWRNKRRSFITVLAVTFAVMLSVAMRSLQMGTYDVNIKRAVGLFSGYLQIQKVGYQKNPSLRKGFPYTPQITKILKAIPAMKGFTPRLIGDGLISSPEDSTSLGVAIIGLVPQQERRVASLITKVNQGRFFQSDSSNEIVIGYKLLKNLKAEIGDEVVILAQAFDGSLGNLKFKIVGTVKSGVGDLDRSAVFMGLSTCQDLLSMYGRITMVVIALNDLNDIPPVQKRLQQALQGTDLVVLNWAEIMPELKQAIEMDNIGGILFLAILVIVVAFGILNTMLMSIQERYREFGIVLALGMPNRKLVIMLLWEILFIVIIGLILGNLFAFGINDYIVHHPIIFSGSQYGDIYEEYGFLPRLDSTLRLSIFLHSSLAVLIISVGAVLYPVYKVFKLEPLKGIRYT